MTAAAQGRRRCRPQAVDVAVRRAAGRHGADAWPTSILIGYAILMFVPFAWSVDHVVQDAARLGQR